MFRQTRFHRGPPGLLWFRIHGKSVRWCCPWLTPGGNGDRLQVSVLCVAGGLTCLVGYKKRMMFFFPVNRSDRSFLRRKSECCSATVTDKWLPAFATCNCLALCFLPPLNVVESYLEPDVHFVLLLRDLPGHNLTFNNLYFKHQNRNQDVF